MENGELTLLLLLNTRNFVWYLLSALVELDIYQPIETLLHLRIYHCLSFFSISASTPGNDLPDRFLWAVSVHFPGWELRWELRFFTVVS